MVFEPLAHKGLGFSMSARYRMASTALHEESQVEQDRNGALAGKRLRLASFNIQTGIHTANYRQYITRSWQHFLPTTKRLHNLNRIGTLLRGFDIVGLQEVEGGGRRSDYVVQTEYLAHRGGFSYWHNHVNRRVGKQALHSNGIVSRLQPTSIKEHNLPGLPGRGALVVRFGNTKLSLVICIIHLALGRRGRMRQIAFISRLIGHLSNVVLMGDMNCEPNTPEMDHLIANTQLCDPIADLKTFPSWCPQRKIDHILVTPRLHPDNIRVMNFTCSDHLPIAIDITLPDTLPLVA